jgi:pSer/pThr/pTyr-binding forkhead associated (FHA) protein
MWKLVIEDDEGKRTVVPLTRDDYTIGRQEGNTIRLTERNVSREHGRIQRKRNGAPPAPPSAANGHGKDNFVLEDRSSYNGLFVNGLRVAHTQDLQHGDLIQIGDYRIVLQDDAAAVVETAAIPITTTEPGLDAKATIPMAAAFRGQDLTDRPSRFVMLVGPTPGVEYPLDRERMTIGRAEDASISVNHNSVSRLHCEVHALGDGRYEIVDKGSSNGVRVNAVELKRSIIEAGDVIELGDVRFKFVGAGQVFVPGPNESQQLTAISDREAELADPRRKGWGGYALPIFGAGLVGALIILAFVFILRARANSDTPQNGSIATPPDTDQAIVAEAKRTCTPDDCDAAYQQLMSLPEKSPWRSHSDFREVLNTWADSMFKRAAAATDLAVKRALLTKVNAASGLDETRRAKVTAALAELDQPAAMPSQLPVPTGTAPTASGASVAVTPPPTAPSVARTPPPHTTAATPTTTTTAAVTAPPATATVKPAGGQSLLDKANEAAAEGRSADVRRFLEQKVRAGHGTPEEVRLVRKACSSPFDKACVDDIKAKYP